MGLFDTIYVSGDVAAGFALRCKPCGALPSPDTEWQTKGLDSCLIAYHLRHDERRAVRLYLLDRPSDFRLWHEYTAEEIAESEREAARGGLFSVLRRQPGDGYFLAEAYLPGNRHHRSMGEWPHQWLELHARCACGAWLERWIKFCDGIATEVRETAAGPEPGFFDGASGFD